MSYLLFLKTSMSKKKKEKEAKKKAKKKSKEKKEKTPWPESLFRHENEIHSFKSCPPGQNPYHVSAISIP